MHDALPSGLAPLDHQVGVHLILEDLEDLDDVRMIQLHKSLNLLRFRPPQRRVQRAFEELYASTRLRRTVLTRKDSRQFSGETLMKRVS